MATSAVAISRHMGKYDTSIQGLTRLHTLLGLEMGAPMISDIQSVKKESVLWKVCNNKNNNLLYQIVKTELE